MNNVFGKFLKSIFLCTVVLWALLIPLLIFVFPEPFIVKSVIIGCLIPLLCFLFGFYIIHRNFYRSMRDFTTAILVGTMTRLAAIGVVVFILFKTEQVHIESFLASLGLFYIVYLVTELYFVNQIQQLGKEFQQ